MRLWIALLCIGLAMIFAPVASAQPGPPDLTLTLEEGAVDFHFKGSANGIVEAQRIGNVLEGLRHGPEIDDLHVVMLSTGAQMDRWCGRTPLACYEPYEHQLIVFGDLNRYGNPSGKFVLAHEYAHHFSTSRLYRNSPWRASLWGTKRWASAVGACRLHRAGRFGRGGYKTFPDEIYADTYAYLHFPRGQGRWPWLALPRPGRREPRALKRDFSDPWQSFTLEREIGAKPLRVKTPLDGNVGISLSSPGRSRIKVFDQDGRLLKRSKLRENPSLGLTNCGQRRLLIDVTGPGGTLTVRMPR